MKSPLLLGTLLAVVLLASAASAASSYTVSVTADAPSYVGSATIHLSGQVSPAPGPGTAVLIRISNPNKVVVTADEAQVNGTTGNYSDSIVAGGSANWVGGDYLVNVTWGAYPPVVFVTTLFSWSSTAVTTTTSTTSIQSTSQSSTNTLPTTSSTSTPTTITSTSQVSSSSTSQPPTTSTTSQSTSTTSSSSGGGIPEFPFQAVTVAVLTVLVLASYIAIRGRRARDPDSKQATTAGQSQ